jgi:pimeloyl-ACP methyl ester carboxylesterase
MPDIIANGAKFHYELDDFTDPWVKSETVWLQHGFGRSGKFWYQWVPPLSGKYRVIRRDMRGHGLSQDPGPGHTWTVDELLNDMKSFLDELEIESVHYVGESVGAMLGACFAARWPERIKSLTLSSMAMFMDRSDYEEGKLAPDGGMDWPTALKELGVGGWAETQMVPGIFAGMDGSIVRKKWLVSQWDKTPRHVAVELQAAVMNFDVRPFLSQIKVPTLVLAPTNSALQPLERQVQVHRMVAGSKIAVIEGPGHEVYFDSAEAATAAHLKFIKSL